MDVERQKITSSKEPADNGSEASTLRALSSDLDNPHNLTSSSKIALTAFVDLALFEDLWYMVCARVRELYSDLNVRFQSGFITAETVLHNYGSETTSFAPWRARDMVTLLQEKWSILMDKHVVGTLDHAVRTRSYNLLVGPVMLKYEMKDFQDEGEHVLQELGDDNHSPENDMITADDVAGLENINQMPIADFVMRVWWKVGPIVEKESIEEKHNQQLRMMARLHVRRRMHFNDIAEEALPTCSKTDGNMPIGVIGCECTADCHCKTVCDSDPWDHCFCKSNPLFLHYLQQNDTESLVRDLLARTQGQVIGEDYLFDAPSNDVAQLQVATAALGYGEDMVEASAELRSAIESMQDDFVARRLEDEGTRVPKTPIKQKKAKDVYPLDYYNEVSYLGEPSLGQRHQNCPTYAPPTPPMSRESRSKNFIPDDESKIEPLQPAPLQWRKSSSASSSIAKEKQSILAQDFSQIPVPSTVNNGASPTVSPQRSMKNQRYVLAGGNTPFEFRPEVAWTLNAPIVEGLTADKEQFFNALSSTLVKESQQPGVEKLETSPSQLSVDSFDNKDGTGRKRRFNGFKGEVRKLFRKGNSQ